LRKKVEDNPYEFKERVEVVWVDSHTIGEGWQTVNSITLDEQEIKTVGYVVFEDDKSLILVQTITREDDSVLGGISIPKSSIRSRKAI